MSEERYFIKAGYRPNEQALTIEEKGTRGYWTESRVENAAKSQYQYYVYQKAFCLFKAHGYHSLLDIGCGSPIKVKQLLAPHCQDIVLIDQPSITESVRRILPTHRFVPVNLEHTDLDLGRKFDLIICADVLEHLLNPDNCVEFIKRHLASNGTTVLSTPERDYLRGKDCNHCPKPEHVREWNSTEFVQYITSRGFRIREQMLFPQAKLSQVEFLLSRVLSATVRTRKWSSCQTLVCTF